MEELSNKLLTDRDQSTELPTLILRLKAAQDALTAAAQHYETNVKKPLEAAVKQAESALHEVMRSCNTVSCTTQLPDGTHLNAEIIPMQAGGVEDWDALYEWVAANNRFDLLHKRLSSTVVVAAYQEAVQDFDTAVSLGQLTLEDRESFIKAALPAGTKVSEWRALKLAVVKPRKPRKATA